MIFDEVTLRKLTQLSLVAHQLRSGWLKGERRSVKRGNSIEFADYRNYTPGDDLRRLDWNIYARLDRPYLKLFQEEEDLVVHVLLDVSQSMDFGEGEYNKFSYAVRLAAALGAITLANNDWLSLNMMSQSGADKTEEKVLSQFGPTRGQFNTLNMLQFMDHQKPAGQTDLSLSIHNYLVNTRRPGLAFVISDLFSSSSYHEGLAQLQGRGFEVMILHVLAPEEIDPSLAGDLRLLDIETGQPQDVSVDAEMRQLYRQRLETWRTAIQDDCKKRGARYLAINTAQPWDRIVLQEMRQVGILK
jgi:uncharacterized protein (DUF58 family)